MFFVRYYTILFVLCSPLTEAYKSQKNGKVVKICHFFSNENVEVSNPLIIFL